MPRPPSRTGEGDLEGVDAVVDENLTSRVLATGLGADDLVILTDLARMALNFGTPEQEGLDRMTLEEARRYHQEGHFPGGSMGPKIQACIDFLESGGERAIVTSHEHLEEAFRGRGGTAITA